MSIAKTGILVTNCSQLGESKWKRNYLERNAEQHVNIGNLLSFETNGSMSALENIFFPCTKTINTAIFEDTYFSLLQLKDHFFSYSRTRLLSGSSEQIVSPVATDSLLLKSIY